MIIPLRWLNSIFDSGLAVDELLDALTMSGLEVEGVVDLGMQSGKIVVAKALEVTKHPNAEKLSLVKADVGGEQPLDIVCGAPNVREGMLVPCALVGAVLPDGMKIKKSKIRGEKSEGMLCSAKELNFGTDHSGILELPDTYKVGEPFELLIDIKVTPNRADCLSIYGVARDVAAMIGKKIYPDTHRVSEMTEKAEQYIDCMVRARKGCPRYACRYLRDVHIGESPLWLRRRLESVGLRPINNVVDATNYVMMELGIPLHAFDFDRIHGGVINVRYAKEGEKFLTLDESQILLTAEDLVIADGDRPIALAGVMGGKNTEVTESTTHILLECANFEPGTIRRTARRHGFQTDSSYRFERGTDRQKIPASINRATQLIQEIAGGEVARGIIDDQGGLQLSEKPIQLHIDKVNKLLGLKLANQQVADQLVHLGFEILRSDQQSLMVATPSYRVDIFEEVDLIEEVARSVGYDKIPETLPAIQTGSPEAVRSSEPSMRHLREILVGLGLTEAITFTMVSEESIRLHGYDPSAQPRIANPMSQEQALLRASLLPGLLEAVGSNQRQGAEWVGLFEIGKTYPAGARPGHAEDEYLGLSMAITGTPAGNWASKTGASDFYDLKGVLSEFGEALGLGELDIEGEAPEEIYHPGRSGALSWKKREIGVMGELHPDLSKAHNLRGQVYCAEIDLEKVLQLSAESRLRFRATSRQPSSSRDLAVVVDESVPARELLEAARSADKKTIEDLSIMDVYQGEHIEPGKKSIALHFRLRSAESTLTEEEINAVMGRVLKKLEKRCGAALRT